MVAQRKPQNFSFLWLYAIQRESDLSKTARGVAAALFARMDADGSNCYPSYALIGREAGVSRKTAQRAVKELETCGWIEIRLRGGMRVETDSGDKFTNLFVPKIPAVPDGSSVTSQVSDLTGHLDDLTGQKRELTGQKQVPDVPSVSPNQPSTSPVVLAHRTTGLEETKRPTVSADDRRELRERAAELGFDERDLDDFAYAVARKKRHRLLTVDDLPAVRAEIERQARERRQRCAGRGRRRG